MKATTVIRRTNPKSGKVEHPWRDGDGNFVLGDPTNGALINYRDHAILTGDYDKAVRLVRSGYSIRMSACDGGPPSLVRSKSVELVDGDDLPADAVPPARTRAKFAIDEVLDDFRHALIAGAAAIAAFGSDRAAAAFLGTTSRRRHDADLADGTSRIDLSRFRATALIRSAYNWAYQTGTRNPLDLRQIEALENLLPFATLATANLDGGNDRDSPLIATIKLALARWKLERGDTPALSVQDLANLAQATEIGTRNALSKSGISARGGVSNELARRWLLDRKYFVKTDSRR